MSYDQLQKYKKRSSLEVVLSSYFQNKHETDIELKCNSKTYTSLLEVKILSNNDSGAIHLTGSRPVVSFK